MERDLGPLEQIERAVQERAKDISLEMSGAGKDKLRALIADEVARWSLDHRRGLRPYDLSDPDLVAERAYRNLAGYGPLEPLLDDDDVWEVMVNAPDSIFVKRHRGRSGYHDEVFHDDEHVIRILTKILDDASGSHRKLDPSEGLQDAQLDNGARLHIVHGDISRGGHIMVNVRKFTGCAGRAAPRAIAFDLSVVFLRQRQASSLAVDVANDLATAALDEEAFRADGEYRLDPSRADELGEALVRASDLVDDVIDLEVTVLTPDSVEVRLVVTVDYVFARAIPEPATAPPSRPRPPPWPSRSASRAAGRPGQDSAEVVDEHRRGVAALRPLVDGRTYAGRPPTARGCQPGWACRSTAARQPARPTKQMASGCSHAHRRSSRARPARYSSRGQLGRARGSPASRGRSSPCRGGGGRGGRRGPARRARPRGPPARTGCRR